MGEMLVMPVTYVCRCTSTSATMQQFCLLAGRQVVRGVSSLVVLLIMLHVACAVMTSRSYMLETT